MQLGTAFTALGTVSSTLNSVQNRLEAAMTTTEEQIARWTRRMAELEVENERHRVNFESLQASYTTLQSQVRTQQTVEDPTGMQARLEALTAERDDLKRRLRHAMNYAHDLSARVRNNVCGAGKSTKTSTDTPAGIHGFYVPSKPLYDGSVLNKPEDSE